MLNIKPLKKQGRVKRSKGLYAAAVLCFAIVFCLFAGCAKESTTPSMAQVKVKLDYLDNGGYYNDNIDGIPTGLVIGTNGPYTVDPSKTYFMEYKAGSSWGVARINSWSPTTTSTWVIHCYVSGNTARIETYPE